MESEIRQFLLCCVLRLLGFYCEEVRVYGFFDTFLLSAPCNVGSFCVSDLTYCAELLTICSVVWGAVMSYWVVFLLRSGRSVLLRIFPCLLQLFSLSCFGF